MLGSLSEQLVQQLTTILDEYQSIKKGAQYSDLSDLGLRDCIAVDHALCRGNRARRKPRVHLRPPSTRNLVAQDT